MGYSKREIGAVNIDFNLVTMFIAVIVNFNAETWHVVKLILTLVTKINRDMLNHDDIFLKVLRRLFMSQHFINTSE